MVLVSAGARVQGCKYLDTLHPCTLPFAFRVTGVTAVTGKNDIGGMSNFPSHLSQPSQRRKFHPVFAPVGRCVGGERRSGVPPPPEAGSRTRRGTWGFPASAGIGVRSDDGQHRVCLVIGTAAAPPSAVCGAMPHTPKLRAFLWKRFIRLRRRSFKGGPVPL